MATLSVSCVYANFSLGNFPFENFLSVQVSIQTIKKVFIIVWWKLCESVDTVWYQLWISQFCLLVTLWKCQYCVIWTLKKSFYYSLIWKELSKNATIVWYKLWISVQYCLTVTLWKYQYCLIMIWNLEKFLLFASNSLKMSVLFDVWKCV